jgi:hypothetical protein
MKSRMMGWVRYVAGIVGDETFIKKCYSENLKGRVFLGDLDVNVRILLKGILKIWCVRPVLNWLWTEFSGGLL